MSGTTFLAVDWSGARKPAGKIWLAAVTGGTLQRLEACASREAAVDAVLAYGRSASRVVAGFDFSFSLPLWFQRDLGVADAPGLWAVVAAEGEHWLRDVRPPFWGRPGSRRPELPAHFRETEEALARAACIAPKSTFQVAGAGTVGTGSLRGMPHLATLRSHGWTIWPFDDAGRLTAIEIYPRLFTGPVTKSRRQAREAYLAGTPWPWTEAHREAACSCEDAFDAAVSALVMSGHDAALTRLPARTGVARREGEIWMPPR